MKILLLSSKPADIEFFQAASAIAGFPLVKMDSPETVCAELTSNPATLIVLDTTTEQQYKDFENCLAEKIGLFNQIVNPNWMFFIAGKELHKATYLASSELFGTIIPRTFSKENQEQLGHLLKLAGNSANNANHTDIARFFGEKVKTQNIKVTKSKQKQAIVESLKNHLAEIGFKLRTAALIASAADELIMNAIFDAPVDKTGKYIYSQTPRSAELELDEKNSVDFKVAFDGNLLGISVTDQYGSLDKKKVLRHVSKSYEMEEYKVKTNVAGAGVGLSNVYRNCSGIVFECESGTRTTVSVFYKKTASFKEFKDQFRFLSTLTYFT
ncbi:MAG: hypothetical protein HYW49_03635 [Deltaproteobacteria bacterium]|nr:hypothetical protein [Deltaproteobacteria bacterium]